MGLPYHDQLEQGHSVYTPLVLRYYDLLVLGLSNTLIWRCPTSNLRALYDRNVSQRHLDIGVGTGYFLDHAKFPFHDPHITLLDLNPQSLSTAARRIARYKPRTVLANALDRMPMRGPYGSAGLCYLLHCLPGPMSEKAPQLFANVAPILLPGAHVFGATIVQGHAQWNWPSRGLMGAYNRRGIFHNQHDTAEDLDRALRAKFSNVRVTLKGCVALFEARAFG